MIIQTGFEDYILYKDIKIYKARMSDGYQFIRSAGEALTISVKLDKDLANIDATIKIFVQ